MSESPHVEARVYGFFASDHEIEGIIRSRMLDLGQIMAPPEELPPLRIEDARILQARAAEAGRSEAAFFDTQGFVLLPHASAVRDWDLDPSRPEAEQDVMRTYLPEAEALVRERLLPGRRIEVYQGPPQRRGPGTPNPDYATGVHQDYGLLPDAFEESLRAFTSADVSGWWRQRFERDDVEGFLLINLWRPVYLDGPLRHMPLAVCEPRSVRVEDCVPVSLLDITPTDLPTNQLSLRYQPDQRWYYYPAMTSEEVLAFKNYTFYKDAELRVESCFHVAFEAPDTPPDVTPRQSCEHRVSVFLLRD